MFSHAIHVRVYIFKGVLCFARIAPRMLGLHTPRRGFLSMRRGRTCHHASTDGYRAYCADVCPFCEQAIRRCGAT